MREFSVPAVATIAPTATLTDAVWANAEQHPANVQFVTDRGLITCAQFRDEVVALARGLIAAGVGVGDRVALMSKTRYEWTLIDYAIWSVGAVTVPIYETSSAEQVQWILADAGIRAAFVETDAHRLTVESLTAPGGGVELDHLWQIEAGALAGLVTTGATVDATRVDARRRSRGADDVATIIYTSGTTGRPKGCVLTHRNILADILNVLPSMDSVLHDGATTLLFLPLAHSFARLIQAGVVTARVRTAFEPDTRNLVPRLAQIRPDFVLAVPRVFEKVYNTAQQRAASEGKAAIFGWAERVAIAYSQATQTPAGPGAWLRVQHRLADRLVYARLRAALGGRCTAAVSGGAPLGARLAHFFRGIGVTIYEGYGLTETSPALAVNTPVRLRVGTVGRPLPGVTVCIDDDGEILVKGDIVFGGYWNNTAATTEILAADGWLHSGDLGDLDPDGFLSITGRKKELIVTAGGKNVAPAVLEDRVRAHPLVSQCLVIGDRQPFIAALITLDADALPEWRARHGKAPDADLREDPDLRAELQRAVDEANQAVSKAESIRVFRILSGDFTETNGMLTPSLKVKRAVVAKEYADEIAAIYH